MSGLLLGVALLFGCGEDDTTRSDGGDGGRGVGASGATSGAAGVGGGGAGGGGASGSPGIGGSNSGAGGFAFACNAPGTKLPSGACYVPCNYAPGFPPRYEDPPGACSKIGWKCSALQHCNVNVRCAVDASCVELAGPGWACVPTADGPLAGQCAFPCETDADCPVSNGTTPSPYTCKAVDNGTVVVKVCRF